MVWDQLVTAAGSSNVVFLTLRDQRQRDTGNAPGCLFLFISFKTASLQFPQRKYKTRNRLDFKYIKGMLEFKALLITLYRRMSAYSRALQYS